MRCEGSKGSEGSESSEGKVLKMDGPSAQGFLRLTAFQAEGCGIARRAISMKSALRIYLSVSYSKISITVISHLRWLSPFGALRHHLPPTVWWDNKEPQSNPFISSSQHNGALLSPVEVLHRTSKWGEVRRLACPLRRFPFAAPPGKVVAPATKGGMHFLARQGGCMVFPAAARQHLYWRP